MKVIGTFGNPRVLKVLAVAQYAGVEVQHEVVTWEQVKAKEFANKQPLNKIPVLETPEGPIYESNAICRYVARKGQNLLGANEYQQAQVEQYLDFFSFEVEPAVYALLMPILGYIESDAERTKKANGDFNQSVRVLENALKGKSYLVNDTLSLADVVIAASLVLPFRFYIDEKQRKGLPNLTKWFQNIAGQDKFKKVYGAPVLATQALHGLQSSEKKKEEPKKKEQPKKEAPKKAEKKPEVDEEPKSAKNPLDALPPTSFNFFDFKTLIVNAKDKKEAVAEFWKQYDAEGFSIWLIHYDKYEGEGEKYTHTLNLKNGFLQRLDHFRKYCFGSFGVFGDEPNLEIRGMFVWRSTGKPAEITDHAQYDYHKFFKMDHTSEKDRALVEEYWCNLEDGQKVEGLTVQENKYFK